MPNGGPNCTHCVFNRAKREFYAQYERDKAALAARADVQQWEFQRLRSEANRRQLDFLCDNSFCLVHQTAIENPLWTICDHGTDLLPLDSPVPAPQFPIRGVKGPNE